MAVLGIDLGTQSVKAVVTDESGNILGKASHAVSTSYPHNGWAEQDHTQWTTQLEQTIARAVAEANCTSKQIDALAVSGQLDGCIGCTSDGTALSPCIIWMDKRADVPPLPDDFSTRTGLVPDPSHMGPKIRWLRQHGTKDATLFHQPVSYLVDQLTGAKVMDHSLASTTMLYSLGLKDYDPALLAAFDIDVSNLPAIAPADSLAGQLTTRGANLTGLLPGTPVAVGTGDDFATPLGAQITHGTLACVVGTAEVVGSRCHDIIADDQRLLETHPYPAGGYFLENPGWLSGGALAWVSNLLGAQSFEQLDDWAAQAPAGCNGLLFIPGLTGTMAPRWREKARGCFYGLTPKHGKEHMARAVIEGCAFALRDVALRSQALGVPLQQLAIMGGGVQSALGCQIRADVCHLDAIAFEEPDLCARGAALLALAAIGDGAKPQGVNLRSHAYRSNKDNWALYEQCHKDYLALFSALEELW